MWGSNTYYHLLSNNRFWQVFYTGKIVRFCQVHISIFWMDTKIMTVYPMSVLLIILYTLTMLLHQKNAVTTSKLAYLISCYHIKTCYPVIGSMYKSWIWDIPLFTLNLCRYIGLNLNMFIHAETWHKSMLRYE